MTTSFSGDLRLHTTILTGLRRMAREGRHASEMAKFLIEQLGSAPETRALAVAFFSVAFGIGAREAHFLREWHAFPGATWTDQQLNDSLDPLIQSHAERWRGERAASS